MLKRTPVRKLLNLANYLRAKVQAKRAVDKARKDNPPPFQANSTPNSTTPSKP